MKHFLHTIKDSVSNREWYHHIVKGEKPIGFLYIFLLKGIVGIVVTLFISMTFFSAFPVVVQQIKSAYPKGLEVKIEKGLLSTNQDNPYYLFNKEVVIDTTANADVATLRAYKVKALITETDIISVKRNGSIEIIPVKSFPSVTINQKNIDFLIDLVSSFKWMVPIMLLIGTWLFGTLGVYLMSLVHALVVWGVLKLMGHRTSYRNAYSVALYGQTIPIVFLLNFAPTLIVLIVVTLLMFKKK
mgnify:FL=1